MSDLALVLDVARAAVEGAGNQRLLAAIDALTPGARALLTEPSVSGSDRTVTAREEAP